MQNFVTGRYTADSPRRNQLSLIWQQRVGKRDEISAELVIEYPNVRCLDLRTIFIHAFKDKTVAKGIVQNLLQSIRDGLTLRTDAAITGVSAARGLHYTLDGIHLNVARRRWLQMRAYRLSSL